MGKAGAATHIFQALFLQHAVSPKQPKFRHAALKKLLRESEVETKFLRKIFSNALLLLSSCCGISTLLQKPFLAVCARLLPNASLSAFEFRPKLNSFPSFSASLASSGAV